MATEAVAVGDWIRPYSSGIWKVARILTGFNELRYSLAQPKVQSIRTLVFSNRLVNNSWKRSFATECSELAWVSPIQDEERLRIDNLLHSEVSLRTAFEKYEANPKQIDLVVNLGLGQFPDSDRARCVSTCGEALARPIQQGLTLDEVLEVLRAAGFDGCIGKTPTLATLQLVSPNHELRAAEFVMRRYRFLGF